MRANLPALMKKVIKHFCGAGVVLSCLLWANAVCAEQFSIQVGNIISDGAPAAGAGRIDVNSDFDTYTFTGTSGQNIFVEELGVSSAFAGWLRWELKAPSGTSIFSNYLEGNNEGRCTLPENGTYTVRVWVGAVNAAYIGTYSFRLRAIPADPTFPIQFNDVITNAAPAAGAGNIEVPGAWDYYTFSGTNGQITFFEMLAVSNTFQGNLKIELKAPSGNLVFASYMTAGNHPGRKVLNENGTYKIRVFVQSNATNHVGTYSIRMRSVAPDQAFVIQPGDLVTNNVPANGAGNIEMPGAQDFYTFVGTAGQSISFQGLFKNANFGGWLQWEAKTPGGQTLFSAFFGDVGRKTLPETGTYTIRFWVGDTSTSHVGNYSFRLYTLPGDVRCTIQKGDVVSDGVPMTGAGRIDEPGGLDAYTFAGLAGQTVDFEQLGVDPAFAGYLYWQVVAPGGSNWFSGYFPGNNLQRRKLPETGNYTVRVYANTPNSTHVGPYSFKVWCEVHAEPDQFVTLPNATLTIPNNKFLCNDSLEIGDAPTVDTINSTSARGGALTSTNGMIVYVPPAGFTGIDSFTYRLRGQYGGLDTANVTVRVGAGVDRGAAVVSLVREGQSVMVCLFGAPNQKYTVEQSFNCTSWSSNSSLTADGMGSMTYTYPIEAVEKKFYRFMKQ